MSINLTPATPTSSSFWRLFACFFRQRSKTKSCPKLPSLDGKNVLITGGRAGVGEYISRTLLKAGAKVTSISRGKSRSKEEVSDVRSIFCDLANPDSIVSAVNKFGEQKFDIVICNSGVVLDNHTKTLLGLEKTFAVNVFGHHLLYRLLIERGMIVDGGRIVITTGEIYVNNTECVSDPTEYKGSHIYAGSKLGNLWQVLELTKRYPNIKSLAVHPGVVASGFGGGSKNGFSYWVKNKILISEEQGAQSSLIAATQNLPNGAYWHNVHGNVALPDSDPARDSIKSLALWEQLESLAKQWL